MAGVKKQPAVIVTERHRFTVDDEEVARFLAALINQTGIASTDDGWGIYDFDLETTVSAHLEGEEQ